MQREGGGGRGRTKDNGTNDMSALCLGNTHRRKGLPCSVVCVENRQVGFQSVTGLTGSARDHQALGGEEGGFHCPEPIHCEGEQR